MMLEEGILIAEHCNTDVGNVWTTRGTMLKNKLHLVTFHEEYLGQPMNSSTDPPT